MSKQKKAQVQFITLMGPKNECGNKLFKHIILHSEENNITMKNKKKNIFLTEYFKQ